MWRIPILSKDREQLPSDPYCARKFHTLCRPLPTFYMSDYSVLGLLVNRPEEAVRVLGDNKYSLTDDDCGVEVAIDHPHHLQDVRRLLSAHGIDSEIGDVVHEIYQG